MLTCVITALLLARRRTRPPFLMAVATVMKLLPLTYARQLRRLPPRIASCYAAILGAGLALPVLHLGQLSGHLPVRRDRKGHDWLDVTGALLLIAPFTLAVWYVEDRSRV